MTTEPTKTEEKKEEQPFYIDPVYKVLRIGNKEWEFIDCSTTEKRDKLKSIIAIFEKEMEEAIKQDFDSLAITAKEKYARAILELCLPDFKWEEAANDEDIGIPLLEYIAKDFKSFFFVIGGLNGWRALSAKQLLTQSLLASLKT
jgi:hypothetical protein